MDNGRASIDPVSLGIESDRQLFCDIRLNLAYHWFCRLRLDLPELHHSSLTPVRDRMGESRYRQGIELISLQWPK